MSEIDLQIAASSSRTRHDRRARYSQPLGQWVNQKAVPSVLNLWALMQYLHLPLVATPEMKVMQKSQVKQQTEVADHFITILADIPSTLVASTPAFVRVSTPVLSAGSRCR